MALLLRHQPASALRWWHYGLFGYATLAVLMPWLNGGVGADELSVRYALLAAVVYAAPVTFAAMLLRHAGHDGLSLWAHGLLLLWFLHFGMALALLVRRRAS